MARRPGGSWGCRTACWAVLHGQVTPRLQALPRSIGLERSGSPSSGGTSHGRDRLGEVDVARLSASLSRAVVSGERPEGHACRGTGRRARPCSSSPRSWSRVTWSPLTHSWNMNGPVPTARGAVAADRSTCSARSPGRCRCRPRWPSGSGSPNGGQRHLERNAEFGFAQLDVDGVRVDDRRRDSTNDVSPCPMTVSV